MERESGYYWVKIDYDGISESKPQPAFWNGKCWSIIYSLNNYDDSHLLEINETKIPFPNGN